MTPLPAYEDRRKNGFDSPMKALHDMTFAPFHTIGDMMTVILRIDAGPSSNPLLLARFIHTLLSDLVSIALFFGDVNLLIHHGLARGLP